MEDIRVLVDKKDKYETYPLYEDIFPEDKGAFLDWYYEDRCLDNIIIDVKRGDEVISMAHLNPFTICTKKGTSAAIYYIYAVATKEDERHKGYMAAILNRSFDIMRQQDMPFCFLIPVHEEVYTPFGFHTVSKHSSERIRDYNYVTSNYDIYIEENDDYVRRANMEDKLGEGLSDSGVPEDACIMAKIISKDAFIRFSGLPKDATEDDMIEWLKTQNIYISEVV